MQCGFGGVYDIVLNNDEVKAHFFIFYFFFIIIWLSLIE